jgi:hypothetical protein
LREIHHRKKRTPFSLPQYWGNNWNPLNFSTTPSDSLIVPWNLLYLKNLRTHCSVSGTFNPVSHATYLLQKINPHLDFTSEEILTQIDQFILVTTYINGQLKTDIKNYYHYWIFKLFQESCDAIGLTRRQEVTNYDNAVKYAGDDIKACFILQHAITKIKDAFASYLANRVVFIHFIMEDHKMSLLNVHPVNVPSLTFLYA